MASSGPDVCHRISADEKAHLESHGLGLGDGEDSKGKKVTTAFPWKLFTFRSSWATIYAHSAFNFGRYFVYNSLLAFYVDELGLAQGSKRVRTSQL